MGSVLENALGKLTYEEMRELQQDLSMGIPMSKQLLQERLDEAEASAGVCSVCGSILKDSPSVLTLIFGPAGLKKKSSFCALDCMEYFTQKMKTRGEVVSATAK